MLAYAPRLAAGVLAALALCVLTVSARAEPAPANDYGEVENWLCLPGGKDACAVDQTTTVIAADGTMTVEPFRPDPNPSIDCFYLYPTASEDPTGNSDMVPGVGEKMWAARAFARFTGVCRTYAPMYRSVTLARVMGGRPATPVEPDLNYRDVRDAWRQYLAARNQGRGVVLISHSQGAGLLDRLIREEIDGKPVQARMVSAVLMGGPGRGAKPYAHIPLCGSRSQTGCAVVFAAFRAATPPSQATMFGHLGERPSACVNPAAPGGGHAELQAYLDGQALQEPIEPWVRGRPAVATPFVKVPGLLSAECVRDGDLHYLAISVHGDPKDPRVDDIKGDLPGPDDRKRLWGLHVIEPNLVMGDLLSMVREQAGAFASRE